MEGIAPLGTLDPQHAITQLVKALAHAARAFAFVRHRNGSSASACLPKRRAGIFLGYNEADMAATATPVVLDTPAAEFRLPATDGKTYGLDDVAGKKRHGHRFHLQSLPLCQSGDRPHGCGRACADVGGHRLCGDLRERRGELSR